jgi:xanthine dehydrogenase accessory factor
MRRLAPSLATRHAHAIPSGPPSCQVRHQRDEAHRFGLPCGGTLELLLEFDPTGQPEPPDRGADARLMRRRVRLSDGAVSLEAASAPADLLRTRA